jgi:acetolactate synthase-1/2/3 large subunit
VERPAQLSPDPDTSGGAAAIAAAAGAGVRTLFTLSGAHVFPLYDAAHRGAHPIPMIDVRHEASAVFAAEAVGKLTRTPGFAVVTAGPGVTNAVSPITQAYFSGAPLVVFGGRAPEASWGRGALQELDQAPILTSVTKASVTVREAAQVGSATAQAFATAAEAHRGPVFLEAGIDTLFLPVPDDGAPACSAPGSAGSAAPASAAPASAAPGSLATGAGAPGSRAGHGDLDQLAALIRIAERPIVVIGADVWADGAEREALVFAEQLDLPVVTNGMGRGIIPGGHPCCVSRARTRAFGECDLAIVIGTPLDFRLGYGAFGPVAAPAPVIHLADAPSQLAGHRPLAGSAAGGLGGILTSLTELIREPGAWRTWRRDLSEGARAAYEQDRDLLRADRDPIHPARIYGDLLPRLTPETIVIGDGGDFVSWAGRFVHPSRPGRWLDPGPFGCLGAGLGAAIGARVADPHAPIVLLLGDGAAGMSLMDLDTLVRHKLPVVIVLGNNSAWGLEKGPMQMIYGYDVLADLAPQTRYDQVVTALGGAGELITRPRDIGPALDRAFTSGVPYLLNVVTDPAIAYPRATTGL